MAAYANLVSLMHLIEQIQLYHAHHPTFLDEHQKQLESLHKKVTDLQDLLEWCSLKGFNEAHDLESRIANAANGAEDIIELYIVGDIHGRSWKELIMLSPDNFINVHKMDTFLFSEELQKVIGCMDFMEKEMVKVKELNVFQDQRLPNLMPTDSPKSPLDGNNDMVGLEDEFNEIMNKLTHHGSNLKIISLIGMGGIGKSTLARNVCENRSTKNYFDVRGWIIISQEFNVKKRMFDLLKEIGVVTREYDEKKYDYHELGEKLHKHLSGRRFLITVDDIWSVEDWGKFKLFLPDNNNGSRIILTTRLSNVAKDIGSSHIYSMNFLDENTSWSLLCKKVFLNEPCPPKLLEVGKKVAKNCKGLPLSLSVIGGLLAKSEKTLECWERIAGDINTIVTAEDDERYLKILALSYSHLPIYLKPCFLYMGIFPEDYSMDAGALIDLWIAEGFLKRRGPSKSFEEVAQNYLEDLLERSLIYVSKIGNTGKTESIRIHDLLRDLALREAQKEKFLHVTTLKDPSFSIIINSERRVGLHDSALYHKLESECENALSTATSLRSLICDTSALLPVSHGIRLLRVSEHVLFLYTSEDIFHIINSRYLNIFCKRRFELSSLQLLWNVQIIFITRVNLCMMTGAFPIWEMPLLRKLDMSGVILADPPRSGMEGKGDLTLTNLQKISSVMDFKCTDAVLRKISNIKELALIYSNGSEKDFSNYCLYNLGRLHMLQNLEIQNSNRVEWLTRTDLLQNIGFSQSLKKLLLQKCGFEWEHLTTKVGSLPHLEELILDDCYTGEEWILVEGAFLCLKVLKIIRCHGLVLWSAESIHFPCLEHLFIEKVESLVEIPFDIGDIASLQTIQLKDCSKSILASAKMIIKEQRSFGNDGLRISVNQKHVQQEDEEEEEKEEKVQGEREQEKKKSKGFVAFVAPFLVILGFSYVLLRNKFGGRGKEREDIKEKQKEDNGRRGRREADDSWFSFCEFP